MPKSKQSIIVKPPIGNRPKFGHPLSYGLIGCYLFNGLVRKADGVLGSVDFDSAGLQLPVVVGNIGTGGAASLFGPGLKFTGALYGASLTNTPSMSPLEISVVTWIKADSFTPGYTAVYAKSGGTQLFVKSTGKLAIYMVATGGAVSYDGAGAHTLVAGQWYQLALTYSAGNGLKGYVNGIIDSTAAANGTLSSGSLETMLGADVDSAGRELIGLMDHLRIYNRALLPGEVRNLYRDPFAGITAPRRGIRAVVAAAPAVGLGARYYYQMIGRSHNV